MSSGFYGGAEMKDKHVLKGNVGAVLQNDVPQ